MYRDFQAFVRRFYWPIDSYERHFITAKLLLPFIRSTVLDVGGYRGHLNAFLPPSDITTVNVDETGDVRYDGVHLPFPDHTFDAVTSIDVLEHIPPEKRKQFAGELLRVAKRGVVLCAPFASNGHHETEKALNKEWRRTYGADHHFLAEHIRNGLITLEEIKDLFGALSYRVYYFGDYTTSARDFRRYLRYQHTHPVLRLLRQFPAEIRNRALFNSLRLSDQPKRHSNRFYVVVDKGSS